MPHLIRMEPTPRSAIRHAFEPVIRTDTFPNVFWYIYSGLPLPDDMRAQMAHTLLVAKPNGARPPDIIGMNLGPYILCRKLKEKIDELEPGVHEFFPLEVVRDDKSAAYGTYFLLHLKQACEAVIWNKTEFRGGPDNRGLEAAKKAGFLLRQSDNPDWCTLQRSAIEGRHLWRTMLCDESLHRHGSDPMRTHHFCSDELRDFVVTEKLIGWLFYEVSAE